MGVRRSGTIQETKLQSSRATMAHLVHILGIMDSLVQEKKGDAGKPALHETLVQRDKGPCETERGQTEEMSVSHLAVTAVESRTMVLVGLELGARQKCQNMFW